ncbi:hypothetical protein Rhopal_000012-T1 [Rhodotorula paludigena]|uniref:Uncharacterized protein n=1 Tax=Rhodotorula paludigena TaxID=86838 RepID=A0AAV5GCH8_9BASI|nr:hypothetical protein Rhopal_000008-T1 [Rhodotorula paludigena]GJN87066.1 hypothetical protein Rhopal_000010-T1 [Rhodotorula paludigena]GJN87068.1 hypothetical protein Rhopal_000012-T1 [Rhodotorula paludigena]
MPCCGCQKAHMQFAVLGKVLLIASFTSGVFLLLVWVATHLLDLCFVFASLFLFIPLPFRSVIVLSILPQASSRDSNAMGKHKLQSASARTRLPAASVLAYTRQVPQGTAPAFVARLLYPAAFLVSG